MALRQLQLLDHPVEDFGLDPQKPGRCIEHGSPGRWSKDDPVNTPGEHSGEVLLFFHINTSHDRLGPVQQTHRIRPVKSDIGIDEQEPIETIFQRLREHHASEQVDG